MGLNFHIDENEVQYKDSRLGTKLLAEEMYRGPFDLYIKIRRPHSSLVRPLWIDLLKLMY